MSKKTEVTPRGVEILHDSFLNKGTAFTAEERDKLGLRGLLPPHIGNQNTQVRRVMEQFDNKPNDLEKFIFMIALQDRNENLFYRVVLDHIEKMMPIIYTPTVGKACQLYGHIFRRPRGIYVSSEDRGRVTELLKNWPHKDVRVIVVTDGQRILGLGDLGANGMGIPVGKLSLYTACAGIHPTQTLPITIDVGTNNEELLNDPLYIGLAQHRLTGDEYDALIEEFLDDVQKVFPDALVQFEDFGTDNAFRLLRTYRDRYRCFNDDIQGTAAVALAGLVSSLRITGGKLADQRMLFLGAGEAGTGIGDLIVAAMMEEGIPQEEAREKCWFVDSRGLVVKSRTDLAYHKQRYAHDAESQKDFLAAIQMVKPTAIIGVSGQPATFTKEVVEAMTSHVDRPIIFALSNPTSKAECTAEQAYTWSRGRAVFASGSPFDAVEYDGRTYIPGQGNNAYVFPGIGLGVVASGARRVTAEMFLAASRTLAGMVAEEDLASGLVYPRLTRIREVSRAIAIDIARIAHERDLATRGSEDVEKDVDSQIYVPDYPQYA